MTGALTAEFMKLVRHRATWGLVWIFPLGVIAFFLLSLAVHPTGGLSINGRIMQPTATIWMAGTAAVWKVAGSGPGRFLIGAFTALAFGGEYGWNTWKLIVPHRRRMELIGAKHLVVLGLLMASVAFAAVLSVVFGFIGSLLNGGLPDGVDAGALLIVQSRAALTTLIAILLTMGYASAGAIVLRSTLGGAIVSIAAVVIEGVLGAAAPLLNPTLFLSLPTYHLKNLDSWIETGAAAIQPLSTGLEQAAWPQSLIVVAAWTVLLFALAAIVFEQQDLN